MCNAYANGFLTGVTDAGTGACPGATSLAALIYHPNNMVKQVTHGNNVLDVYGKDPNDMGRPASIATSGVLNSAGWNSGTYRYDGAGNVKALRGMSEPIGRPAATGQLYQYDSFGNLKKVTTDGSDQTIPTDSTTNRMPAQLGPPALNYDDTGNLTAWGGYTYAYDGFNAMTSLGGLLNQAYTYDANGERLSFSSGGTTTYSLRGLDGKVLRDYTYNGSTWTWSKDVAYRAGQLLATIDGTGTKHMTLDHLGSPRLITNADRSIYTYHAYWAYGLDLGTDLDPVRMKFTGHERDNQGTAGALDYMHARYYSPVVGKFLSVDLAKAQDPKVPQSWNKYAYSRSNPLTYSDPNGKWPTSWWPLLGGPVHQAAIERQLSSRVSPRNLAILMQAQVVADSDQTVQARHAMGDPGEQPESARAAANDYVRGRILDARSLWARGQEYHDQALLQMGLAIHAVGDSTSPSHEGFQSWVGSLWNPANWCGALAHGAGENFDPGALTGESRLDDATLATWRYFEDPSLPLPADFFDASVWEGRAHFTSKTSDDIQAAKENHP